MKTEILHCAEQQLMRGGYKKLNFATIAEQLNTTRANLHYHFKNKETLAIEVTRLFGDRQCNLFNTLRESNKGNFFGFMNTIDECFWHEVDDIEKSGAGFYAMLASDPDIPKALIELAQNIYDRVNQIFVRVIEDAKESNEIRADIDVEREAMRLHVILMGILTCGQSFLNNKHTKKQLKGVVIDWSYSLK